MKGEALFFSLPPPQLSPPFDAPELSPPPGAGGAATDDDVPPEAERERGQGLAWKLGLFPIGVVKQGPGRELDRLVPVAADLRAPDPARAPPGWIGARWEGG